MLAEDMNRGFAAPQLQVPVGFDGKCLNTGDSAMYVNNMQQYYANVVAPSASSNQRYSSSSSPVTSSSETAYKTPTTHPSPGLEAHPPCNYSSMLYPASAHCYNQYASQTHQYHPDTGTFLPVGTTLRHHYSTISHHFVPPPTTKSSWYSPYQHACATEQPTWLSPLRRGQMPLPRTQLTAQHHNADGQAHYRPAQQHEVPCHSEQNHAQHYTPALSNVKGMEQLPRRSSKCKCDNCRNPERFGPVPTAKKKHICSYDGCHREYGKTSHLKAHERSHRGERPFKCDWEQCNKSFTRTDELSRHKRIHKGEKPFPCDKCTKKFTRSDHLKKHMKIHNKPAKERSANPDRRGPRVSQVDDDRFGVAQGAKAEKTPSTKLTAMSQDLERQMTPDLKGHKSPDLETAKCQDVEHKENVRNQPNMLVGFRDWNERCPVNQHLSSYRQNSMPIGGIYYSHC